MRPLTVPFVCRRLAPAYQRCALCSVLRFDYLTEVGPRSPPNRFGLPRDANLTFLTPDLHNVFHGDASMIPLHQVSPDYQTDVSVICTPGLGQYIDLRDVSRHSCLSLPADLFKVRG